MKKLIGCMVLCVLCNVFFACICYAGTSERTVVRGRTVSKTAVTSPAIISAPACTDAVCTASPAVVRGGLFRMRAVPAVPSIEITAVPAEPLQVEAGTEPYVRPAFFRRSLVFGENQVLKAGDKEFEYKRVFPFGYRWTEK